MQIPVQEPRNTIYLRGTFELKKNWVIPSLVNWLHDSSPDGRGSLHLSGETGIFISSANETSLPTMLARKFTKSCHHPLLNFFFFFEGGLQFLFSSDVSAISNKGEQS